MASRWRNSSARSWRSAITIDEAMEIMRKGPRTCEYYYVISDAKSMRAGGIACTPEKFEVIWNGEAHPQLPHAVKDTVLLSAGDRYEELARRVQAQHGTLTADSARELMTRPVCMGSNIQSVLFAPKTLDFWVANADAKNVASHTRYHEIQPRGTHPRRQPVRHGGEVKRPVTSRTFPASLPATSGTVSMLARKASRGAIRLMRARLPGFSRREKIA